MGTEPHLGFSHDPLCTPGHQPARVLKRFGSWVGTNGILLVVRHHHGTRHQHDHPEEATVSLDAIAELFQAHDWRIEASYEHTRTIDTAHRTTQLHDVVVRVQRFRK